MAVDPKAKAQLIRRMKVNLRPNTQPSTSREGVLYDWFIRKLEGVIAYGMSPVHDQLGREVVRLRYVEGRPMVMVCSTLGIRKSTAYAREKEIFEAAADTMPEGLVNTLLGKEGV